MSSGCETAVHASGIGGKEVACHSFLPAKNQDPPKTLSSALNIIEYHWWHVYLYYIYIYIFSDVCVSVCIYKDIVI